MHRREGASRPGRVDQTDQVAQDSPERLGANRRVVIHRSKLPGLLGAELAVGLNRVDVGEDPIALALKSGNFGTDDFFEKALRAQL